MKTFTIKECRNCSSKLVFEEEQVILNPGEEVDIVILTTAKCNQCKMKQIRTEAGPKVPFTGK